MAISDRRHPQGFGETPPFSWSLSGKHPSFSHNHRVIMRIVYLLFATLLLVQCSDDKVRDAATQAAKENPAPETKATPGQKPAMPTATAGSLSISATGKTTFQGSETCVAVTARDFRDIVSMQYTMQWDPKVLTFKNVRNFGLPGLNDQNFGAQATDKGLLTYSWFDINVKGITMPDGFTLYDVCFEVTGAAGSKSGFRFINEPTIIEITNAASQFLDLQSTAGLVEVR